MALVILLAAPASAGTVFAQKGGTGGTVTAGNTMYQVHVEDVSGNGVGLYTVSTGPSHPAGGGLNLLYGVEADTIASRSMPTLFPWLALAAGIATLVLLGGWLTGNWPHPSLKPNQIASMVKTPGVAIHRPDPNGEGYGN